MAAECCFYFYLYTEVSKATYIENIVGGWLKIYKGVGFVGLLFSLKAVLVETNKTKKNYKLFPSSWQYHI